MNPPPGPFDHLSASVGGRLRDMLFGAALKALALGLACFFAALAIGFGALAAYAALCAAEGPVAAAMIVGGLCAGLALATFLLLAWRGAPAPPTPTDPLVEALLAAMGAQDQLARAWTKAARVATRTRLVVLALGCGLAAGARLRKRPVSRT